MDFLDMCQQAIVAGLTNVLGTAPTSVPTFLFYPATQTFRLTIPQTLGDDYNIEMSSSLKDLFNFQTTQISLGYNILSNNPITTYQIVWTNVGTVEDDYNASCRISNNIYPFDLYMLECSTLPINPMTFVSTRTRIFNGADLQKKIVKRWRNQYDMLDRYTSLTLDTEEQTDKLRPMTASKMNDNVLTFILWVRTRREQEYLEWALPQGNQIKFLLNTYALV